MSIQSEIERMVSAKENLRTSIINKGVDIPQDIKIDEYSSYVDKINVSSGNSGGIVTFKYSSGYNGQECMILYSDGTSEIFSSSNNNNFNGELSKRVLYVVSIGSSSSSIQINSGNATLLGEISHTALFTSIQTQIVRVDGDCSLTVD